MLPLFVAVLLAFFATAEACRCVPQELPYNYCLYPVVMRAVAGASYPADSRRIVYELEIKAVFKNGTSGHGYTLGECIRASGAPSSTKVYTFNQSSLCRAGFDQGQQYLIFAHYDADGYTMHTSSCYSNRKWADVSEENKQKLESGELASQPCPTPSPGR